MLLNYTWCCCCVQFCFARAYLANITLWTTCSTCVKEERRTTYNTIRIFVIQWDINKWPCILLFSPANVLTCEKAIEIVGNYETNISCLKKLQATKTQPWLPWTWKNVQTHIVGSVQIKTKGSHLPKRSPKRGTSNRSKTNRWTYADGVVMIKHTTNAQKWGSMTILQKDESFLKILFSKEVRHLQEVADSDHEKESEGD